MKSTTIDYLIVGQGLAGSAVAAQLLLRGKKIVVVDKQNDNTASKIAAGLFNPVTGKFVKKTWLADDLFPYLSTFYRHVEKITASSFFHPMPLYCPFRSIEEQNEWMAKSADHGLRSYIDAVTASASTPMVNDGFGGLTLGQGGYLDTIRYIEAVRRWICRDNVFIDEHVNFDTIEATKDAIYYKDYKASCMVLCQGEDSLKNRWFEWAPVIPLKGETLTIQTDWHLQQIVNRGVYIVPADGNALKVGATYDFNDHERSITRKGRIELEEKLRELIKFDYTVTEQQWSMRPTTPDRRPLLGTHPENERVAIFNGLGTKGTSIAPYFSDVLVRWLEKEKDLNKEINVNRYKSLYSKFTK